jgi:predicted HTH transcriptional regulator
MVAVVMPAGLPSRRVVVADELSELVDSPVERLDVEYKSWIDLAEHKHRADLARHIAAISNFGGGSIVFGIDKKDRSCGSAPTEFKLDHDTVASITRKYLEPTIHCDVHWTKSIQGTDHPVLVVPPHGPTPICAKANGPIIKGKIEGIIAGATTCENQDPRAPKS